MGEHDRLSSLPVREGLVRAIGWGLQLSGVAIVVAVLASGLVFAWPRYEARPGVSAGPDATPWMLGLAAAMALANLASIRWRAGGLLVVVVSSVAIVAGFVSRLLTATAISSGVSAGAVVVIGGMLAVLGVGLIERSLHRTARQVDLGDR